MATLTAIRSLFRAEISQTDSTNSDITDSRANEYANMACRHAATICKWPRDHAEWTVQTNFNTYDLPTDFISAISAKFGTASLGDIYPLKIFNERELDEYRPGWMNTNSASLGKPDIFMLLDRYHFLLNPTPDTASNGKKVILTYVFYPPTLVNDTDVPDLPLIYHDYLSTYMAHLAYGGLLKNPEMAEQKNKEFMAKIKSVELQVTQEKEQMNMSWGGGIDLGDDSIGVTIS